MYWKKREVLSRPLLLSVELSFVLFCCKQIQFEILTSKEIICIKADRHHGIINKQFNNDAEGDHSLGSNCLYLCQALSCRNRR